jgi:hypothetical protein
VVCDNGTATVLRYNGRQMFDIVVGFKCASQPHQMTSQSGDEEAQVSALAVAGACVSILANDRYEQARMQGSYLAVAE